MYDFRVVQTDDKGRTRIKATCSFCKEESFVRRDFAVARIKRSALQYVCRTCSSKRNIKKARREQKMDDDFISEFIWLCEQIFTLLYDDLHPMVIAKKLDNNNINFIEMAREFVYEFLHEGVDNQVIECAEKIESGVSQDLIDLYPWTTELYARAMLHLESLPHPEGL